MVYNDEYFTLNVNEAYSFKLMCLQVPLDTKYKWQCLLKAKCCLYCFAFTDMWEIMFPIIRLSEYFPMFEGKQFVKILYNTLVMGISKYVVRPAMDEIELLCCRNAEIIIMAYIFSFLILTIHVVGGVSSGYCDLYRYKETLTMNYKIH